MVLDRRGQLWRQLVLRPCLNAVSGLLAAEAGFILQGLEVPVGPSLQGEQAAPPPGVLLLVMGLSIVAPPDTSSPLLFDPHAAAALPGTTVTNCSGICRYTGAIKQAFITGGAVCVHLRLTTT